LRQQLNIYNAISGKGSKYTTFHKLFAIALMEMGVRIIDFSYLSIWRFDSITGRALLLGSQM
jgi:hypothetical protein